MHRRILMAAALAFTGSAAHAQAAWPYKPITYVVPFGAGGTTDVLARLVTRRPARRWAPPS